MADCSLFHTCQPLILASASPRRKQFLTQLGLDFDIITASIDETPLPGELPGEFTERMARIKALSVSKKYPRSWTIGADTIITVDGRTILGKPANQDDALNILRQLAGNTHQVMTGLCLGCPDKKINLSLVESTSVTFIDADDTTLKAYIATEEPLDKAGAYGIQGIGSFLVKTINGSCSNVIGLPVNRLVSLLVKHKIIAPSVPAKKSKQA